MRLVFVHYFFTDNGVTRSVVNNIKGLKELSPDFEFALIGDSFASSSLPDYAEKRFIDWNSVDLVSELEKLTKDADAIIIENPVVGMYPHATLAFREFSEKNADKNIIYRIHDFIDDRPHLIERFSEVFSDLDSIYPRAGNVTFITLTNSDRSRLEKKGLLNVRVLPNSVIISDLVPDKAKSKELRNFLERKNIVLKGEKILLYPVRIEKRKNIEEALLIAKLLNDTGGRYRLVVTLPFLEDYSDSLRKMAEEIGVPCSLGEVGRFIGFDKKNGFSVAELFDISDMAITTSVREGFGFAYLEPWISGTPLIGRKIPEVAADFESSGINLAHMYDNSILPVGENPDERMSFIKSLLSDKDKLSRLSSQLNIMKIKENASCLVEPNSGKAIENYGHVDVARKFLLYFFPMASPTIN